MAAITVQTLNQAALNHTYGAIAASGDTILNDGNVFLLFKNSNASARTLTMSGNATDKPGFGTISAADMAETYTIPGSGTNGGECIVGPFPPARFNNSSGQLTPAIDVITGLTVAAVNLVRF
jgi:hypothetical protein